MKICLTLGLFVIVGCSFKPNYLHLALDMAGDNRAELENVLEYYKDDPLKYEAACFLIENMPAHYSYKDSILAKEYYERAKTILSSDMTPYEQRDTLYVLSNTIYAGMEYNTVSDVKIIKADFLIRNLEYAFREWTTREWAQHLTFSQFCEWILPYKAVEFQEMDCWRDTLSSYFTWGLNNMIKDDDLTETAFNAANVVRNEMNWRLKPVGVYTTKGYPLLSASTLHKQTHGTCLDYVTVAVLTFRSVGIPSVIDETPYWGRYRAGHSWYTILNNRGEELTSEWDISSQPGGAFFIDKRIPKVYRNTFSINRDRVKYLKESPYKHPFKVCQSDITDQYFNTSDIEVELINHFKIKERYCYIATFTGLNEDWSVVDYGTLKRGRAHFRKMGRNILYIALGFDGVSLRPISNPFILHTNGEIEYIKPDNSTMRGVTIKRKYYQSNNVARMAARVVGGKIQASNDSSLKSWETLFEINSTDIPDKIKIDTENNYRYWRYLSPNGSYGSIAELAFFDSDTTQIDGEKVGNIVDKSLLSRAFDGDWLTNFETANPDNNWVGMDLGRRVKVSYVRVVPRGDDNNIHPGDTYELKYWGGDAGWISKGVLTATENSLYFDSIPQNTLMWVHNYTRGWDERPFMIDLDGCVKWW